MDYYFQFKTGRWSEIPTAQGILYIRGATRDVRECVDLEELISNLDNDGCFEDLSRIRGFFAWVHVDTKKGVIRASTDHIRSIPLFYSLTGDALYLSDSAEWIRAKIGAAAIDLAASEEFALAGYVTGSDTLYKDIKQIQAGEIIEVTPDGSEIRTKANRFFQFTHFEPAAWNEQQLLIELEDVAANVFRRLSNIAAGRKIVVPLSGGYDSRLIATMLRRSGYKNVLCYSYGLAGNAEAQYSKKVAQELGYEWCFVEYSPERWREHWRSHEAEEYRLAGSNHSSLPHVQDWLAIRILSDEGRLEENCIIVPGHTGDFIAGGHIPEVVFGKKTPGEDDLYAAIIARNLSGSPTTGKFGSTPVLTDRIRSRLVAKFDGTREGFANLYELWDWQERQAKYIVNSVRVYDQFGFDWWLPLWDISFVEFWQRAPLSLRQGRVWYCNWVSEMYADSTRASNHSLGNASDRTQALSLLAKSVKRLPRPMVNVAKSLKSRFQKDPMGFEGLVTLGDISEYRRLGYNRIGTFAKLYLDGSW